MSSKLIDNQKLTGGVLVNAGNNTNVWYERDSNDEFTVNGSFNPLQGIFDWVLTKSSDSKYAKSNVVKFKADKKTVKVSFKSFFPDDNYFVFFSSNDNVNLYWSDKKRSGFVINSSSPFKSEVTWLAIHKDFARLTGINNPGTIYAGTRILTYPSIDCSTLQSDCTTRPTQLDVNITCHANREGFYECEYIIAPSKTLDGVIIPMDLPDGYSTLLSTSNNINTFWVEKAADRVRIGASYPVKTTIDYLLIKNGIDWWEELP